ncbi:hypothetical protein OSSY52_09540 [Tepiditoga spiralis]|uniref:Uncharacterized protein n=1 Tax=Tepiditoga spiralis TaxID=2108365 RepID=A0A7G1G7F8_9BACT|nr:hypothetical protein [Tepiditoga spiralis]BBE30813.1 hypothetical protein OSSY52_09540 [Tepiditoga spiralis]
MKMTPELIKAEKNMKPGVIVSTGFLGEDNRHLSDIIESDEELINELNLKIPNLVEKMKYLLKEGEKGLGEPITIDKIFEVMVYEARGVIPCPFEDGVFKKINVKVKNKNSGKEILYSDLSIHLIEKHHFFQGKGSDFRLDPEKLKETLELEE